MEKMIGNEDFDYKAFQKEQGNFDLKVNINKKREHSVNQLLSLIPGNDALTKSPVNAAAKLLNPKAMSAITRKMQKFALLSTFKFSPL